MRKEVKSNNNWLLQTYSNIFLLEWKCHNIIIQYNFRLVRDQIKDMGVEEKNKRFGKIDLGEGRQNKYIFFSKKKIIN